VCLFPHARVNALANVNEDGALLSTKGFATKSYPAMTWADGFSQRHTQDSHTCCYAILDAQSGAFLPASEHIVRMSKPGLALMHALRSDSARKITLPADVEQLLKSVEPMGTMLLIDLDNPGHLPWTPEARDQMAMRIASAAQLNPIFAQPTMFHTTRGGLRMVWALDDPVLVEGSRGLEDLLCGLIMSARMVGLEADASCGDWTRLFRLPLVVREGKKAGEFEQTWAQGYLAMSWGRVDFNAKEEAPATGQVLVHSPARFKGISEFTREEIARVNTEMVRSLSKMWDRKIGREPVKSVSLLLDIDTGMCPDAQKVSDYQQALAADTQIDFASVRSWVRALAAPTGKNRVPDPAAKFVWDHLFGTACLVDDPHQSGQLHANLLTLTSHLAWTLRQRLNDQDITPQTMYLLCIQAAKKANKKREEAGASARSDSDLEREVWSAIESAYRMRASEQKAFALAKEEEAACAQEKALLDSLVTVATEGAFKEFLMTRIQRGTAKSEIQKSDSEWVEKNFRNMLVLDSPDGLYTATRDALGNFYYSAAAKDLGALLACMRDCGHDLLTYERPPTPKAPEPGLLTLPELKCRYSRGVDQIRYTREIERNSVRLVACAEGLQVALDLASPGMRSDIEPIRDRQVEQWLNYLGGPSADKLLDWLACYQLTDHPMTGLYIQGAPSIGKGMLGQALSNMTQTRSHAKFERVMEQFQDSMLRTPFVWGDEEASPNTRTGKSMMQTYKKLVTGEFDSINPKGKSERDVKGYWRVYLSANDDRYIKLNEDASDEDMDALVLRVAHILADSEGAARYLREIGGRAATNHWPERNIPCHVQWLRETRQVERGSRLIVEGVRTAFHDSASNNTERGDIILRSIAYMLASGTARSYKGSAYEIKESKGDSDHDWRLWIHGHSFHKIVIDVTGADPSMKPPTARNTDAYLRKISENKISMGIKFSQGKETKKRAWPIPLRSLLARMHNANIESNCRESLGEEAWQACAPQGMKDLYEGMPPPAPPTKPIPSIPFANTITPPTMPQGTSNTKFQAPLQFPGRVKE
jgi:hypothetical protein